MSVAHLIVGQTTRGDRVRCQGRGSQEIFGPFPFPPPHIHFLSVAAIVNSSTSFVCTLPSIHTVHAEFTSWNKSQVATSFQLRPSVMVSTKGLGLDLLGKDQNMPR